MRPPPLLPPLPPLSLLSLLLLLGGRGAAAPPADSLSQLPAPRNPKVRLYNAEQVLSWEPVSLSNDTRPVVYQVQHKYRSGSTWYDLGDKGEVNCMNITTTECDFTRKGNSVFLRPEFDTFLRVRAKVDDLVSPWLTVPSFRYCRNVTVGPPESIWVTPGEGSLIIRLSSPFDVHAFSATFLYYVHYWEKAGIPQVKGPFRSTSIVLNDLKPLREYCLQVKAQLVCEEGNISRPGHLSNVSCYKTAMDAATKLQQIIVIAVGLFLFLSMLAGACFFLVLKYRGLVKYWFHSPPSIPLQIEESRANSTTPCEVVPLGRGSQRGFQFIFLGKCEKPLSKGTDYLKDPAQPILEALDKDSSPKDDAWDSVSIVSFPEKEQEDVLQSILHQSPGPVQQPVG
ncbi:interferon gamma receptor 2 [Prionailurus iriomotensis]